VTSWGGNAIRRGDTWHLYVTEMAGAKCGLHVWGTQSTVVHAVSPNATGPYVKVSTVLPHEAHNPETIEINGTLYIFHIGTANSAAPATACNSTTAHRQLVASPGCPAAPAGYTAFPSHCVGPVPGRSDCTASGDGWQIGGGDCGSDDVKTCAASASRKCEVDLECHAFALHVGNKQCTVPKAGAVSIGYKLMRLGLNSTVPNSGWIAYAKPGAAPRAPVKPKGATGSKIHRSIDPAGPFLPVVVQGKEPGCNNPSPFLHANGTLFMACTWALHSAPRPEGPWGNPITLSPPSTNTRHWEDPYLFINERGFHLLAHCYSMAPYPSNAISGHAFSLDGHNWTWSAVEPYDNAVPRADGTIQRFATMERPKFLYADLENPTRPTHLINGVSPFWNESNAADPCAVCGHCSACKCHRGIDWTYTLARELA
jgi:hypothetical protein